MDKQTALEIGELANELYAIDKQLESMRDNDFIKISICDYYTGNEKATIQIEGNHKLLHTLKAKIIKELEVRKISLDSKLSKF